jgi:hypothetical protein
MTKYDEVSALAGAHSERFFANKQTCERVALKLSSEFCRYLEAPSDAFKFVELDEDLMAKRGEMDFPKLRQGRDGYWYFALRVHFKSSKSLGYSYSFLKFGLNVSGSMCSVKLEGTFTIDLNDVGTFEPLFADILRGYKEYYSAQPSSPSRPAGFIQASSE